MKMIRHQFSGALAVMILLAASFAPAAAQAADPQSGKRATGTATSTGPRIAAGAAEDTLDACMARIPKDASAGQRMLAEQGCLRDEGDRTRFSPSPAHGGADTKGRD